jgi:hypothetical protein
MPAVVKTFTFVALVLASSVMAAADPIVILRDGRRVSASSFAQDINPFTGEPNPPVSTTREQVQLDALSIGANATVNAGNVFTQAFLDSDISDPGHMSAFGAAFTQFDILGSGPGDPFTFRMFDAHAESQSTFAVDFRLASPFNFVFTSPSLHGDLPRASLVGAGSVFFDIGGVEPGSTFTRTGQLSPGDYSLLVEEMSIFGFHSPFHGTGALRFAFDLTPAASPTPEPASWLLLGTAIAGMFGCRNFSNARAAHPHRCSVRR